MTRRLPAAGSPLWLAVAAGTSGVLTWALLALVARAVGPAEFARFNGFWVAVVIASIGLYLPLEQAVGRRISRSAALREGAGQGEHQPHRHHQVGALPWLVAALALAVQLVTSLTLGQGGGERFLLSACFAGVLAGFAWQYPARGELAGHGDLRGYGAVVLTDTISRFLVIAVAWLAGVTALWVYGLVIALASLASGALGQVLAARHRSAAVSVPFDPAHRSSTTSTTADADAVPLAREVASIAVALLLTQLVLNSPNIVASLTPAALAAGAGVLAAAATVVRVPVLVQQFAQAGYIPRVAAAHARGDGAGLRRTVAVVLAAAVSAAVATVAGSAWLGPWVVRTAFSSEYEIGRGAITLLAAAAGTYLVTAVASDLAVAVGRPRLAALAWGLGAVTAVVVVAVASDLLTRVALPMLIGSGVTLVALTLLLVPRPRR